MFVFSCWQLCFAAFVVAGSFHIDSGQGRAESPEGISFDQQIAPLLAKRCLGCHNANENKGELNLSKAATAKAVVSPGQLEQSEIWQRVKDNEMPPKHPLPEDEKKLLRRWIESGAKWGTDPIDPFRFSSESRAGYDWWSLQPVIRPSVPKVKQSDWARNGIDHYILSRLESEGIKPAKQADGRTLLRRLYIDLIGLPPILTEDNGRWHEEILSLEIDPKRFGEDEEAYKKVVSALLQSPHYGERWGRHWLDVIRFGESQGFERNWVRKNAWRYRDWVIHALNQDLPYDEFLRLQIAGDVLAPDDYDALIATGFLVCGTWDMVGNQMGSPAMKKSVRDDHLEDMVAMLGQSMLGLTINCARCHDHKFDPISQREYYQMTALISGVHQADHERKGITLKPTRVEPFEGIAHVIIPKQPAPSKILIRGDSRSPGDVVSPRGLQALASVGLDSDFGLAPDSPEAQRRIALAKWVTDARNPLTPRVMVNRLWHYHFGLGIVDSPSDFGFSGGRPSHPELLDWLTGKFIDNGWKLKEIHRLIVTSATYRQGSNVHNSAAESKDADNRLLWRANSRRLDGESTRDAMLAVSGSLNRQAGGPSFYDMEAELKPNHTFPKPSNKFDKDVNRRTVYRLWARCGNNPFLEGLDCPDPAVMAPRRSQTITPVQSLALLNNRFVEQCADQFAKRIQAKVKDDHAQQIRKLYQLALLREPSPRELELARQFLKQQSLSQLCVVMLNTNEFLFME